MGSYGPTFRLDYYDMYVILYAAYNKLGSKLRDVLHCTVPIALDGTLPACLTYALK